MILFKANVSNQIAILKKSTLTIDVKMDYEKDIKS